MPQLMFDTRGRAVPRDETEVSVWLALHGESHSGRAWLFSKTGLWRDTFYFPKGMCEIGDPSGGFQRFDGRNGRVLFPIHAVSMPRFKAIEKGLIA